MLILTHLLVFMNSNTFLVYVKAKKLSMYVKQSTFPIKLCFLTLRSSSRPLIDTNIFIFKDNS